MTLETYLHNQFTEDIKKEFKISRIDEFPEAYKTKDYAEADRCYQAFHAAGKSQYDIEHLCIRLSSYLACWGMFRNSSFLTDCNSGVHKKAVKVLLDETYRPLFGIHLDDCNDNMVQLIWRLGKELKCAYDGYKPTGTLITKIMLGAVACIPAYDTNVQAALSALGLQKSFPPASYNRIYTLFEVCREKNLLEIPAVKELNLTMPDMRILDFVLFHYGAYIQKEGVKQ